MPQYGLIKYGLKQYGTYILGTEDEFAIGDHIRYRLRLLYENGYKSKWVTMVHNREEISVPEHTPIRLRSNNGEWVVVQGEEIKNKDAHHVRIRAVNKSEEATDWVHGERGDLQEI